MNRNLFVSGVFIALCLFSNGQSVFSSYFVVQPYLQQVTDDSFRVLWETSSPGIGAVQLGVAEFNVLKPNLNQRFQEETSGTFHRVMVNGLKVDEHYFFQAITIGQNGDTLKGPVTPIHIPDYQKMPLSFTVVGDTQGHPLIWGKIARLMQSERPSFVVHVGDMVQYGPHKDDWTDEFFKPAAELFRFYPLYPAIGNHEMNHDWFYRYFDLPSPEWFYTLKKGNVLFVFVNTCKDILPGSEQYKKLESILALSGETWKIMVHHHPVYTSSENSYGNTWFQRQAHGDPNEMHLKILYETYRVSLVLNGHIHMYERTWPIYRDQVDQENGVTYVTLGGGGGGLDKAGINKTWYAARTRSCHHFLNVSIAGNTLYASAIDTAGITFDNWTIHKKKSGHPNAPYFGNNKQYFIGSTTALIRNENQQGSIYYSRDGKNFRKGKGNEQKIPVNHTSEISAYIETTGQKSRIATKFFKKLEILPSVKNSAAGVKATYYEGNWIALPDFDKIEPLKTFDLDSVSLKDIQPRVQDHFAVRFTGSFAVPETDVYRFVLESFDGSKLFIDEQEVISNDGIHYEISKENFVALEKGMHTFEIQYFDFLRRETLNIWTGTAPEKMKWLNELIIRK